MGGQILGINPAGEEAGNAQICDGRDLPWLQEDAGVPSVWTSWGVTYRDVVILDVENVRSEVYNLSDHNLAVLENYEALKGLLREAASASARRARSPAVLPGPEGR